MRPIVVLAPLLLALLAARAPIGAHLAEPDMPALAEHIENDINSITSTPECRHWRESGGCNIVVGLHAGWFLNGNAAGNFLVGDFTSTPTPDAKGFVNLANVICFWRDQGERVPCPPPVEVP